MARYDSDSGKLNAGSVARLDITLIGYLFAYWLNYQQGPQGGRASPARPARPTVQRAVPSSLHSRFGVAGTSVTRTSPLTSASAMSLSFASN